MQLQEWQQQRTVAMSGRVLLIISEVFRGNTSRCLRLIVCLWFFTRVSYSTKASSYFWQLLRHTDSVLLCFFIPPEAWSRHQDSHLPFVPPLASVSPLYVICRTSSSSSSRSSPSSSTCEPSRGDETHRWFIYVREPIFLAYNSVSFSHTHSRTHTFSLRLFWGMSVCETVCDSDAKWGVLSPVVMRWNVQVAELTSTTHTHTHISSAVSCCDEVMG